MTRPIYDSEDVHILGTVFDEFCTRHALVDAQREHLASLLLARYNPDNVNLEELIATLETEYSQQRQT